MRKTLKGKFINKFRDQQCYDLRIIFEYHSPKTQWENMRRYYYNFLRTRVEKIEDMT
jgi:hypothetical protein